MKYILCAFFILIFTPQAYAQNSETPYEQYRREMDEFYAKRDREAHEEADRDIYSYKDPFDTPKESKDDRYLKQRERKKEHFGTYEENHRRHMSSEEVLQRQLQPY